MMLLLAWVVAQAYLTWRRLFAYLRYFQQDGYDAVRFLRWLRVRSLSAAFPLPSSMRA